MESFSNLIEFYDELFPVTDSLKSFCQQLKDKFNYPPKSLQIGCNTGTFSFFLAKNGWNSTGLETVPSLLDSSCAKRRLQLLSIRFFKLSTSEMGSVLGSGFYDFISCLDNRILFLKTAESVKQFFVDTKKLHSKNGVLLLHTFNMEHLDKNYTNVMASRSCERAAFYSKIEEKREGTFVLNQELENSNGDILPVVQNEKIFPLTQKNILSFGKDAGFKHINFYGDFNGSKFTKDSLYTVAVLRA